MRKRRTTILQVAEATRDALTDKAKELKVPLHTEYTEKSIRPIKDKLLIIEELIGVRLYTGYVRYNTVIRASSTRKGIDADVEVPKAEWSEEAIENMSGCASTRTAAPPTSPPSANAATVLLDAEELWADAFVHRRQNGRCSRIRPKNCR